MSDLVTGAQPSNLHPSDVLPSDTATPEFGTPTSREPRWAPPTSEPDDALGQQSGSWHGTLGRMRAVGNSLAILIVQVINKLSTFAAFYIVSITLPLFQFGLYTLVLALRELASAIATFGLDDVLVRMLSQTGLRDIQKRLLRDAVTLKLVAAVLAGIALVAVAIVMRTDQDFVSGAIIASSDLILVGVTSSLTSYYRSRLRSSSVTGIQAATSLLYLGLLGLCIGLDASWLVFLEVLLLSDAVTCVAIAAKLRQQLGVVALDTTRHKREIFTGAIPLGLASIAVLAYTRLDTVLIAQLRGPTEVGLYTISYKITEAPLIIMTAIAASTLTIISRWSVSNYRSQRVVDAARRALGYSYAIMLPIAVGITFFGHDLIALLYGPAYTGMVPAISVLIWAAVAMASNITSGAILTAIRKTHLLAGVSVLNLGVNIAFNLWAIPQWGYFGSAVATAVTEGVNATIQIIILCIVLRRVRLGVGFLVALVVASAILTATFGLNLQFTLAEQIGILCALPVILAIFRLATLDDLRSLARVIRRASRRLYADVNEAAVSKMRTLAPGPGPR